MIADVKALLARADATLLQDAAGAVALVVILVAGLHLPGLV
jgi:hypothetical protein